MILLLAVLGIAILSLGEILLLTKSILLLRKKTTADELVLFRWVGIGLMCVAIPFLHYFLKIESGLIFVFALGVAFLVGAGKVLFTNDGLEWMYREGIWKVAWPFNEKSDRWGRRYIYGGSWFALGLFWVEGLLVLIFSDLMNK